MLLSSTATAFVPVRSQEWRLPRSFRSQVLILLALHVLVWTFVGVVGRSNLDIPGDMVEAYVWGQSLQWGYYKHPPLSAWIAGFWFKVIPESHAGYALLTSLNSAIGLAGIAFLARRLMPANWALLAVAAAALTPGITTMCMRFNANAVLLCTWPWAIALFVRLMQDGRRRDGVACGLVCALAMLGKYYSGVLLATLVITTLVVPEWRRRLITPAPWWAVATMLALLAPHAAWLVAQADGPLQYAQSAASHSGGSATSRALHFGVSQWVFLGLSFGLLALALRGRLRWPALAAAVSSLLRPRAEPLYWLAVLPIAITMLATVVTGARTASVWGLPIAACAVVLALDRARRHGVEIDLNRALRAMLAAWLAVLLLAPLMWLVAARADTMAASAPRAELAAAVEDAWREVADTPLPWISGTRELAASVAFYAPSHPQYWSLWGAARETPWANPGRIRDQGGAIVCARDDDPCIERASWRQAWRVDLTVAKQARGFDFAPQHYVLFLSRPRVTATPPDTEFGASHPRT